MTIYIISLAAVTFAAFTAANPRVDASVRRLCLLSAFTVMVLVAGLRDRTVGTDTGDYVKTFNKVQNLTNAAATGQAQSGEYGTWVLAWFAHLFSDHYASFFLMIAVVAVGCYLVAIERYSPHVGISVFVYMTMGFYTFFFNGARQGLACAITALAVGSLMRRNFFSFLIIVLIASLFHKTALVMLPAYFVTRQADSMKMTLVYILGGVLISLFLQKIVAFGSQVDMRYESYGTSGEGGGYLIVAFGFLLCVIFLFLKKIIIAHREDYNLFLNMYMFGTTLAVVSSLSRLNPSGLLRLTVYFNLSTLFLWPIVFVNLRNRTTKLLFTYVFFLGCFTFFVLTTKRFSNLVPYSFNPEFSAMLQF